MYIGFFGYEILNNLIGVKLPKQKAIRSSTGSKILKEAKKIALKNYLYNFLNFNYKLKKLKFPYYCN